VACLLLAGVPELRCAGEVSEEGGKEGEEEHD